MSQQERNCSRLFRSYVYQFPIWALLVCASISLQSQNTPRTASLSPAKLTDSRIQFFQAQLARDPDYYLNYNRLAGSYVVKARETGDISYYELAKTALNISLQLESQQPEAAEALTQLGGVEFAEHRFSEAATSAGRALKLQPDDPSAIALQGDAQLEMGNYSSAETFFSQLTTSDRSRPHKGLEYLNATRRASLAWMHGDVSQSLSLMRSATELAIEARLPAENAAWTYFTLGEQLFQSGKLKNAEAAMMEALDVYPAYHRALAGMGQIRAAQQRLSEAAGFYKQAQDVVPLPIYAAALGDLNGKMGKSAEAEKQYALVEFIGQLSTIHKQVYNRELALFYADHDRHLGEALELARKELQLRHDVYTWDALAWVLVKNGKVAEARDPMAKALALGTRDPLLFFHAAALEHAAGNPARCAEYARRALELNSEFHVIYAQQARDWASPAGHEAVTAYAAR